MGIWFAGWHPSFLSERKVQIVIDGFRCSAQPVEACKPLQIRGRGGARSETTLLRG
jgi:hypothetical protein